MLQVLAHQFEDSFARQLQQHTLDCLDSSEADLTTTTKVFGESRGLDGGVFQVVEQDAGTAPDASTTAMVYSPPNIAVAAAQAAAAAAAAHQPTLFIGLEPRVSHSSPSLQFVVVSWSSEVPEALGLSGAPLWTARQLELSLEALVPPEQQQHVHNALISSPDVTLDASGILDHFFITGQGCLLPVRSRFFAQPGTFPPFLISSEVVPSYLLTGIAAQMQLCANEVTQGICRATVDIEQRIRWVSPVSQTMLSVHPLDLVGLTLQQASTHLASLGVFMRVSQTQQRLDTYGTRFHIEISLLNPQPTAPVGLEAAVPSTSVHQVMSPSVHALNDQLELILRQSYMGPLPLDDTADQVPLADRRGAFGSISDPSIAGRDGTDIRSPVSMPRSAGNTPTTAPETSLGGDHRRSPSQPKQHSVYRPSKRTDKICEFCGKRESPEWRRGPSGPNSLCNACGIRHAKLRRNAAKAAAAAAAAASASSQPSSNASSLEDIPQLLAAATAHRKTPSPRTVASALQNVIAQHHQQSGTGKAASDESAAAKPEQAAKDAPGAPSGQAPASSSSAATQDAAKAPAEMPAVPSSAQPAADSSSSQGTVADDVVGN